MTLHKIVCGAALGLLLAATGAQAQQYEATPTPTDQPVLSYLPAGAVAFADILGPPPAPGSLLDQLDMGQVQALQTQAGADRYQEAIADAKQLFPRFSDALGVPVDRQHLPQTTRLLYGALHDSKAVSDAAKAAFARPRPFQRTQLARVCEHDPTVPPEKADAGERTSYPSGHTTVGWTTALVLGEIAPDRRQALFSRAKDYGLSRIVCGVHFPSDVEAGRAVATAVFLRLQRSAAFQRDLKRAQIEYRRIAAAGLRPAEPR